MQEFSVLYGSPTSRLVVLWAREVSLRRLAVRSAARLPRVARGSWRAGGAIGLSGFDSAWDQLPRDAVQQRHLAANPATDHLIQMFPPAFWENIVFLIGLLIAAEAALLLIGAVIYLGVTSHQARTSA